MSYYHDILSITIRGDKGNITEIEDGVQKIGDLAFVGCTSLIDVTLPGRLKFCPEGVFQDTPYASAVPQVVIKGERN